MAYAQIGMSSKPETLGRGRDTEMAHVTPGEIVAPPSLSSTHPEVYAGLVAAMKDSGQDIKQYTVGSPDNSINPNTGYREFAPSSPSASSAGQAGQGGQGGDGPSSGSAAAAAAAAAAADGGTSSSSDPGSRGLASQGVAAAQGNVSAGDPQSSQFSNDGRIAAHDAFSRGKISISQLNSVIGKYAPDALSFNGDVVSKADMLSMTPAQFSKISSDPTTGVVGDPNSPFGHAVQAIGQVLGLVTGFPAFSVVSQFAQAATPENAQFGFKGLFGDLGITDTASNVATKGLSTALGFASNSGLPGLVSKGLTALGNNVSVSSQGQHGQQAGGQNGGPGVPTPNVTHISGPGVPTPNVTPINSPFVRTPQQRLYNEYDRNLFIPMQTA